MESLLLQITDYPIDAILITQSDLQGHSPTANF